MHRRDAHVESFYHPPDLTDGARACRGMACFVARQLRPERWANALAQTPRLYCLGKCYMAPASTVDDGRPAIGVRSRQAIVLGHAAEGGAPTFRDYTKHDGYAALDQALKGSPEDILGQVEQAGLRGRGGAGFPTGKKWRSVVRQSSRDKFVVANADEGDAGAYIDRFIIEDDPHCLIEALAIAAYAVGASKAYVYLRSEYPRARVRLEQALAEARREGVLGGGILGRGPSFDIELVIGRGSYICGEETALVNSIEGKRPEARTRPPYPAEHGLFGKPTLVNNVETLANIPWIVRHGGSAYHALGFSRSRGTKVLSLNSLFNRPGLYEVEFGATVRHIVDDLGGGLTTGALKGVIIGGPLAGIIPPQLVDTPLGFEELQTIGASVGHGGVVAFDQHTSIAELIHHVFDFGAYESCGRCTPCRLGTRRIERIFSRFVKDDVASAGDKEEWRELIQTLAATSLCGHGSGLAEFAASAARYYEEEMEQCFR